MAWEDNGTLGYHEENFELDSPRAINVKFKKHCKGLVINTISIVKDIQANVCLETVGLENFRFLLDEYQ